ncbi:hypothetical protein EBT31_17295 [bacterium]|nr:hypothetical protein [bacterium]
MAATTISYTGPRLTQAVSLPITAGNVREIQIPRLYKQVDIWVLKDDKSVIEWSLGFSGTDDTAHAAGDVHFGAGAMFTLPATLLDGQSCPSTETWSIYVSANTTTGVAYLVLSAN